MSVDRRRVAAADIDEFRRMTKKAKCQLIAAASRQRTPIAPRADMLDTCQLIAAASRQRTPILFRCLSEHIVSVDRRRVAAADEQPVAVEISGGQCQLIAAASRQRTQKRITTARR